MSKKIIINQFKKEVSKGKSGIFFEENCLEIINAICKEAKNIDSAKSEFISILVGLFTSDTLKSELDKFLVHLIKRNKGANNLESFAQKVEDTTGFSKNKTSWSRYISNPPRAKISAEIIFYLLLLENPDLCDAFEKKRSVVFNTRKKVPQNKGKEGKKVVLIILAFTSIIFMIILLFENNGSSETIWSEEFHKPSVTYLKNQGWSFIDFDSTYWNQIREDCLTLFTQYGEYSSNLIDSTVHNLVYKKLNCDCCEIMVKIVDFNPYNRYQQAALFLLDEDLSRKNNFRFSFATMKPDTLFESRVPKYDIHNKRGVQVFLQKNGIVEHFTDQLSVQIYDLGEKPVPEAAIWLKVRISEKRFTTYYMLNDSTEDFTKYISRDLYFKPKYLGLACLGNGVKAEMFPFTEEHIPAFFDYVVVKKCE
ncbi:MAG: hypothetical protein MI974_30575 [Chitinophagales bacterium]|nr:hypothetical protein [Chitinophagales bacterium]